MAFPPRRKAIPPMPMAAGFMEDVKSMSPGKMAAGMLRGKLPPPRPVKWGGKPGKLKGGVPGKGFK